MEDKTTKKVSEGLCGSISHMQADFADALSLDYAAFLY